MTTPSWQGYYLRCDLAARASGWLEGNSARRFNASSAINADFCTQLNLSFDAPPVMSIRLSWEGVTQRHWTW